MQFCVFLFISILGVAVSASILATEPAWGYNENSRSAYGPSLWSKVSPRCAGYAQSPIDIDVYHLRSEAWASNLQISLGTEGGLVSGILINNGHSPTLQIETRDSRCATLTGGPVGNSVYVLEQLHFHFGCASNKGSEHTFCGKSYPVEVHLVFYNTNYRNFSNAIDKIDGLAVVGAFFELSLKGSEILKRLESKLTRIIEEGTNVTVREKDGIFLKDLIPALNNGLPYYTYKGSLTTPPCFESVRWILLEKAAPITTAQLIALNLLKARQGYASGKMCNNFRPTQKRNYREVLLIY